MFSGDQYDFDICVCDTSGVELTCDLKDYLLPRTPPGLTIESKLVSGPPNTLGAVEWIVAGAAGAQALVALLELLHEWLAAQDTRDQADQLPCVRLRQGGWVLEIRHEPPTEDE